MFDDRVSPAETRSAMSTLRERGVAKAVIHFSGGNDEGGADLTEFFDADGNSVDVPSGNAYKNRYWKNGKEHDEGWVVYDRSLGTNYADQKRPATAEEAKWSEIGRVLEAPIYDRFGSFAGEFYVDGEVTWNVAAGTYEMHGQEQVSSWEDF